LSGAGKSTFAFELEKKLHQKQCNTLVLDGDNLRHSLSCDLGFSETDRKENIRRATEVAKLLIDNCTVVIVTFISPYEANRQLAKDLISEQDSIVICCIYPLGGGGWGDGRRGLVYGNKVTW
jgi:adenylylsulfate kinase-like enzyme